MAAVLAVAFAGALGSVARYGVDRGIEQHTDPVFPLSTFVINVAGSLVIGFAVPVLVDRLHAPSWVSLAVTFGLVGGFTTFSTFSYETFELLELHRYALAFANVAASSVFGVVAVAIGQAVGHRI